MWEFNISLIWALLGVIIFALGGLIATRYWESYMKSPQCKSSLRLIFIALPILLLGAFLSTYFWNDYFYDQRISKDKEAMTHVLAAELLVNDSFIQDRKFNEPEDSNLATFVVFPRFQTSALQAAIASCLFVDEEDRELFTAIFDLNEVLNNFNNRVDNTEKQMLYDSRPDNIFAWRKRLRDGKTLKSTRQWLAKMARILHPKYINEQDSVFFYIPRVDSLPDSLNAG